MDTAVAIDGCHFTTRHALLCLLPPRCLRSVCRSLSSNPVFPGFPLFVLLAATISAAWPLAIGHCLPDNYPRSSNLGGPRLLSGLHAQQPEPRHRSHGFCLVQPGRRRCSEAPSAMGAVSEAIRLQPRHTFNCRRGWLTGRCLPRLSSSLRSASGRPVGQRTSPFVVRHEVATQQPRLNKEALQ